MKRLILLATLFAAPSLTAIIDTQKIEDLADNAYIHYVQGVIESIHSKDQEEFDDYVTLLPEDATYQELSAALKESFKAETIEEQKAIAEPVIFFAKSLQAKLTNQQQIVQDFNITEKEVIEQFAAATTNQMAYFEALKAYGLQHAFLYTLDNLTKYQREIDLMTTHIANLLCSPLTISPEDIRKQDSKKLDKKFAEFDAKFAKLKKTALIKNLQRESLEAHKKSSKWIEAEKAATNLRFFIQLLELKVTNKADIMKRYAITDPEMVKFCDWVIDNVNMRLILSNLGIKVQ